jgi:hypothetical protein
MRRRAEAETETTANLEWLRTEFIASFMLAVNDIAGRPQVIRIYTATFS